MVKKRRFLQLAIASTVLSALKANTQQAFDRGRWVTSSAESVRVMTDFDARSQANNTSVNLSVDWSTAISETTPLVFGSNDYEIMYVSHATDAQYQDLLNQLNIPLIRIHHIKLSEKWSDATTQSWNEAKIKTCYDASYYHQPEIVQTIPQWPSWMKSSNGLLDSTEYANYANFCGELVRTLNQTQNRQITYWEPFNELDKPYKEAGKLDDLWEIYNQVATRMKQVDSQIKIGGPILTWDDSQTLNHFLDRCRQNVDFISWHRYASGDKEDSTAEIMAFTAKYGDQTRKFRSIVAKHLPNRQIPLFLSEYNINYAWDSGETRQNTYVGAVWFASVLKHLAEAGIEMAASWHLKDGIYGMIDPDNNLRPAATVFAWANKFLIGKVMENQSDRSWIEALPIEQQNGGRSLLLINKSDEYAQVNLTEKHGSFEIGKTTIHSLDAEGVKTSDAAAKTNLNSFTLNPYSVLLLHS
ncbi:MAG: alpha-L-arabinofuranosidase [Pleurocapsa sp.]